MAGNLLKAGYSFAINDLRREQAKARRSGAVFGDSPKAVQESCEIG
jgi:3-hydroxyisobutyrate dehydrogenase-like beta-hydroxyacid dehydrogenase